MKETVRIGWGSAYADDNLDPAEDLAQFGRLDALCFDALAERTLALAQIRRRHDPLQGYDLRLDEFGRRFLPYAAQGLKLVTNMGAANPMAAAHRLSQIAQEMGLGTVRIAAVTGDDVTDAILALDPLLDENGRALSQMPGKPVCANAYIGAEPLVQALNQGADVVVGGRIADPSLGLAVLRHGFGWSDTDWNRLGQGIVVGHVLECGTHVTGGNFADPPYRVVPHLDRLGMPLAEVKGDGSAIIGKLDSSGGMVTTETVKAQLVYEIHNPAQYFTPDVTADFCGVEVLPIGPDRVMVVGGRGTARPQTLKVLVGIDEGWHAEAEISFAGPGAYERARLSQQILLQRVEHYDRQDVAEVRCDLIGINAIFGPASPQPASFPEDVRVRLAAHTWHQDTAERLTREVEWQYFGPSGGGGVRRRVTPRLAMYSTRIDAQAVRPRVAFIG
ncbi:MAG: ABC transporter substrate-binding protein [Sulfobacillus acidophilus]|uniref:ABC transporter substrate-binding protein n=1 Tax=Sulfobacillus acidophilus TaxID=53633 RepID=A0A2T2WNW3_9FIRM|nr:MAG: ABC transporter substrate-binding protein [Sulfobacillus acidophilus]